MTGRHLLPIPFLALLTIPIACGEGSTTPQPPNQVSGEPPVTDAGQRDAAHFPDGSHPSDGASDAASHPSSDASDAPVDSGLSSTWSDLPPVAGSVWVRVRNSCSFPLWIHAASSTEALQPDDAQLATGETRDYKAPQEWSAARVTAYSNGPRQGELEKAELTFSGGTLNYNVTYVDWVGLPLEIAGVGGNCNAAEHTTGCYAKESQILTGCPEPFLLQGKQCIAPRSYCLNAANQGSAYCHALDSAIAACPSCGGGTTTDVYACTGPYQQNPRYCAALNRAMTQDPDNANSTLYYQHPPFNTYSKWVHQVCPNIYAFPYDDWQAHGGFRSCSGVELRITFCPSG